MPRPFALVLLLIAAPALAQPTFSRIYYVFCDPADPRTMNGAHACDLPPPGVSAADRAVARLYAAAPAALAPALDDHVTWTAPNDRAFGPADVARRIAALPPPETLTTDPDGRIVATARDAAGVPQTTVWTLLDDRVVAVEHRAGRAD